MSLCIGIGKVYGCEDQFGLIKYSKGEPIVVQGEMTVQHVLLSCSPIRTPRNTPKKRTTNKK
eukprot:4486381-Amphidinium_carterae.1